ncbi:MAG TPA: glutamate--tRNA ligase family protein [Gemmatimonadales bacterium]|nr:glutamate--tRNA ligase family protein [Gemmatimonadales bacterium]
MTAVDLDRLRRSLPPHPLTRFAPSPTGHLHLGHAVNAVYVWGIARALGGRVLLRIEDHDRTRCRPEFESALLEDLEWLGLEPHVGSIGEFRAGRSPFRQSDNDAPYAAALAGLAERAQVYACACSRRDLAAEAGDPFNDETPYRGRCRERGLEPGPGRGMRVVLEPGAEGFDDSMLGPQRQEPAVQCGDLLLRDRLGQWTYQFAVVVDDMRHEIDLVIRGADLLASTGRQIRLARMLGRAREPVWLHHPLILKPTGEKLSKASRDTGLGELRAAGVSAADVLGEAAYRGGLLERSRPLRPEDLPDLLMNRP